MWHTGILRKRIRANKEDMEKVINILMSIASCIIQSVESK